MPTPRRPRLFRVMLKQVWTVTCPAYVIAMTPEDARKIAAHQDLTRLDVDVDTPTVLSVRVDKEVTRERDVPADERGDANGDGDDAFDSVGFRAFCRTATDRDWGEGMTIGDYFETIARLGPRPTPKDRRRVAWELRRRGLTYKQIGQHFGVTPARARTLVVVHEQRDRTET